MHRRKTKRGPPRACNDERLFGGDRPRANEEHGDGWHPGSFSARPFAGSTSTASLDRRRRRDVRISIPRRARPGDEGCSVAFRVGARSDIASDSSSRDRRPACRASVVATRSASDEKSRRNAGFPTRLAFSMASRATVDLESPVSAAPRHSVLRLRSNRGSVARPRGRGGRGSFSRQGRCPRWK